MSKCIHHEVELGIVIGKKCKNISKKDAMDYILGYLVALDITARDIQINMKKKGWPWTIAKSFDTFGAYGPYIVTDLDPDNVELKTYLNGQLMQQDNTKNCVFNVSKVLSFITRHITSPYRFEIDPGRPPIGLNPGFILTIFLGKAVV